MKQIPNILTLLNLFIGALMVISLNENQAGKIFILMPIALCLDFLDGFFARLLKAYSAIGKQLDSLADLLSFGLVPAFIFYYFFTETESQSNWLPYLSFLLLLAAAWRLAKFNIDTRQSKDFLGLPTPATAIYSLGLLYIFKNNSWDLADLLLEPWLLIANIFLFSVLMIVEIPMFSLKINRLQWGGNQIKFIFVLISIILLLSWKMAALPIIIGLYLVSAMLSWLFKDNKNSL